MDRPFDYFRDIFRKSNEQDRELFKYVFEKSDSISLWVIGLAVGGISIFANNISDIQKVIDPGFLKPILLLLAISVTSDIIFRGLYLYFFGVLDHIYRGIDISFSRESIMDASRNLADQIAPVFATEHAACHPCTSKFLVNVTAEWLKRLVTYILPGVRFLQ